MHPLTPLFKPRSVAVVGASQDPLKWGNLMVRNLHETGFEGSIYPINPRGGKLYGYEVYPSVTAVPDRIDLVAIGVRREIVPRCVADCADAGVKTVVVITGGFGEEGEAGRAAQDEIVSTARRAGVRLVGPNCFGIYSAAGNLNLTPPRDIPKGPLGVISQSGNLAVALFEEGRHRGVGFSCYVGIGNQADIGIDEYVEYLAEDADTRVIVVYAEGLPSGRRFVEVARRITPHKPILILKGGRTAGGRRMAALHTGSLAGDEQLFQAACAEAGVIPVDRTDELFTIAEALCYQPVPRGRRVASVTDGGAHAVLFVDACERQGLVQAPLRPELARRLAKELPDHVRPEANPIDTAGAMDFDPQVLARCVEPILADEDVDGMVVFGIFGGYRDIFHADLEEEEIATARRLVAAQRKHGKPFVVHSAYGWRRPQALRILQEGGIPVTTSLEAAVSAFRALADYGDARRRLQGGSGWSGATTAKIPGDVPSPAPGSARIASDDAFRFLRQVGLPAPEAKLARTAEEVRAAARLIGFPVVLKVESPDISHKSDVGGVLVGIGDETAATAGYERLLAEIRRRRPDARVDGVLVMPQVKAGTEVFIGALRDPQFGPFVLVGSGGVYVELFKDVVYRLAPVNHDTALKMVRNLRFFPLLAGERGTQAVDLDAIADVVVRTSEVVAACARIAGIDLNPVMAYPDGAVIVDCRILVEEPDPR